MFLKSVHVSNFRNIGNIDLILEGGHAALIGPNGSGKTNFLESVFFTLKGRPFRNYVKKDDLFQKNATETQQLLVKVNLSQEGYRASDVQVSGDSKTKKFAFSRNEKRVRVSDLSFRFPVIIFSPQDHELIRGGPEIRRNFLDQVFADICPGYYEILSLFEQSLKQRNRLLRQIAEGNTSLPELRSWNEVYVERAFELHQLKQDSFPEFRRHFLTICSTMNKSFFQNLDLSLKSSLQTREELSRQLLDDYPKDLATQWTHSGPQRDDLQITISGQISRTSASQGQARLLGLLMRWAHAQWIQEARQEQALFILDDFSSELDEDHREQLIEKVFLSQNQVLWSATEVPRNRLAKDLFKSSKLLSIYDGNLVTENSIKSNSY